MTEGTSEQLPADYVVCPGTGQRFDPRPERLGYWLPCPVCERDLLPRFGGVVPQHRTPNEGGGSVGS